MSPACGADRGVLLRGAAVRPGRVTSPQNPGEEETTSPHLQAPVLPARAPPAHLPAGPSRSLQLPLQSSRSTQGCGHSRLVTLSGQPNRIHPAAPRRGSSPKPRRGSVLTRGCCRPLRHVSISTAPAAGTAAAVGTTPGSGGASGCGGPSSQRPGQQQPSRSRPNPGERGLLAPSPAGLPSAAPADKAGRLRSPRTGHPRGSGRRRRPPLRPPRRDGAGRLACRPAQERRCGGLRAHTTRVRTQGGDWRQAELVHPPLDQSGARARRPSRRPDGALTEAPPLLDTGEPAGARRGGGDCKRHLAEHKPPSPECCPPAPDTARRQLPRGTGLGEDTALRLETCTVFSLKRGLVRQLSDKNKVCSLQSVRV